MLLIGLHGPAGSGKDTIGERLFTEHGFEADAFAAPMRAGAVMLFGDLGLTPEHFTDPALKERPLPAMAGMTPRQILRILGEAFRQQKADIWIAALAARLDHAMAQGVDRLVITDVRLELEAQFIARMGGQIWLVQRPNVGYRRDHVTEMGLPTKLVNRGVVNDGTIADLHARVDALVREAIPEEAR